MKSSTVFEVVWDECRALELLAFFANFESSTKLVVYSLIEANSTGLTLRTF